MIFITVKCERSSGVKGDEQLKQFFSYSKATLNNFLLRLVNKDHQIVLLSNLQFKSLLITFNIKIVHLC